MRSCKRIFTLTEHVLFPFFHSVRMTSGSKLITSKVALCGSYRKICNDYLDSLFHSSMDAACLIVSRVLSIFETSNLNVFYTDSAHIHNPVDNVGLMPHRRPITTIGKYEMTLET